MTNALVVLVLTALGVVGSGVSEQTATRKLADGTGPLIAIEVEQMPSPKDVIFRLTITNTTDNRAVMVNAHPRTTTRSAIRETEIEMSIMDKHRRMVPDLCEFLPAVPARSQFVSLNPKEKLVISYDLDHRCYSLIPGESLLVQISYGATKEWPMPEAGQYAPLGIAALSTWKKTVVPSGWKDSATPTL